MKQAASDDGGDDDDLGFVPEALMCTPFKRVGLFHQQKQRKPGLPQQTDQG